ncbi:metal-dependent hydrolase [Halobacterium bonnevillei]|uniref:Metal-dependent hydrolase n=1 Tax=Halobacterium bonnevillei TaxID=2692200 RepID=A0A6B0SIG2_9EURY|nr:metal-dependent hydrolase [Halobacterium bonnevillei]MXR21488.1 metal-dependent hydrolase [Halobacterium bonnevillei]
MNEREHALNAVLLGVGLGVIITPTFDAEMVRNVGMVAIPVVLGALFPDLDTSFGTHRQTFHNLLTLGVFAAFPLVYGNLHYVWIGVLTHFTLDLLGNVRGLAFFYPYSEEYDVPVGVTTSSRWALPVTLVVTAFELGVAVVVVHLPELVPAVPPLSV